MKTKTETPEQPRRMLDIHQVIELVPLHRKTINRLVREGRFPQPHLISGNHHVWYADEVAAWQKTLPGIKGNKRAQTGAIKHTPKPRTE